MIDYSRIREDMDVCDLDGDKIGTVGRVHIPTAVSGSTGAPGTTAGGPGRMESRGVIEVDTGFLGLGKDLYIPFTSLREIRNDAVYLTVDKDDVDRMGWDQRPNWVR